MSQLKPITDYYGTEVEIDPAFESTGLAVYLTDDDGTYLRFTPDRARELAKRLETAADEIEGRS